MTSEPVRALVVSDTHLGPGQAPRLLDRLGGLTDGIDVVLHAGDVVDASVLDALAVVAPVHAVLGNNDHGLDLPERFERRIGACRVAMVHDSGPSTGRAGRLRRWFPTADVVVFGHSHIPRHERDTDATGHVQHQVNPGSAMQRRGQPHCTVALLTLAPGAIEVRIVPVPASSDGAIGEERPLSRR